MGRMAYLWLGFAATVLTGASGCHALTFRTEAIVDAPRPIEAKASVTMSPVEAKASMTMSPPPDPGPVVVMPLTGGPCPPQSPKIAVIDLDGPLVNRNGGAVGAYGENPVNLFREKLAAAEATPDVVGVVLRINSPGGSVAATEIMASHLKQFKLRTRRPVVACVLDVGAGGAYYLASGADHVVAYPSSLVGGIGVVINLYNLREALGTWNILPQSVKSGKNIDMGTVHEALTPDAEAVLKKLALEFHISFVTAVRESRPGLPAPPSKVYDGRVYSGRQAVTAGLVDRVGTLEDAIAFAAQMSGRPDATPVLLHRAADVARTPFAVTRNEPATAGLVPVSIPGLSQREMPTFLYMWDPLPTSH